jgi:hypothetical protein
MKLRSLSLAIVGIASALTSPSHATVSILDPGYSFGTYHSHSVATSAVTSFDWDASDAVYYQTATSAFAFGGLFRWNGVTQTTAVVGNSDFSGAGVVRIGDNLYFNSEDFTSQKVFKYGPLSGSPNATNISTGPSYDLFGRNPGEIFITGSIGFGTNQIFYTTLDGSGNFTGAPVSLGLTIGSSGPIAFDLSGNMYYAPGFGNRSIYKYTAADVAAAITDPITNPLPAAASRLWRDYSVDFAAVSGGTGMAFDEAGDLLLTLTDFDVGDPSFLVRFDVDAFGAYEGFDAILSSTNRLGDVRFKDGSIYIANADTILQVVPEPGTIGLVLMGCSALALLRRRG